MDANSLQKNALTVPGSMFQCTFNVGKVVPFLRVGRAGELLLTRDGSNTATKPSIFSWLIPSAFIFSSTAAAGTPILTICDQTLSQAV